MIFNYRLMIDKRSGEKSVRIGEAGKRRIGEEKTTNRPSAIPNHPVTKDNPSLKRLSKEIRELRSRLQEDEEVLRAIRSGEVDALVISGPQGEKVFTLKGADHTYRVLMETMNEGAATLTADSTILFCNTRLAAMLKRPHRQIIGTPLRSYVAPADLPLFDRSMKKGLRGSCQEEINLSVSGETTLIPTLLSLKAFIVGDIKGVSAIVTDISEIKRSEEALKKTLEDLDQRVRERTLELSRINRELSVEIDERKQVEHVLKEREKELEIRGQRVEETNIALNVLLKKKEEDKTELEGKVLSNIERLIVPYLEKLKRTGLDEKQITYIHILESNLKELVSPFSHKMSAHFLNFTPTEIQVANLLRQDKTNKEISELLNSSPRTIAFHRENIRKKLKLVKKKTNLKSFLLSVKP